jgi:hypothetical protein
MSIRKLLFAIAILLVITIVSLGQSVTVNLEPICWGFVQKIDTANVTTYDYDGGGRIGRLDEDIYQNRYRARFEFDFSGIPQDARIDFVKITYYIGGTNFDYKAQVGKVSNDFSSSPQTGWTQMSSFSTIYFTNIPYVTSYFDQTNGTLTTDVTTAIRSDDRMISLGIKSLNESNNPSDAYVGIDYITVKYTPKVIVTIQNSFGSGTVEVDGSIKTSPWTSPSTGTSVWYSGDSHSIRAYTQAIESVTYPFEGTWTKLNSSTQLSQTSENTPVTINPTSDCAWRADFGNPAVQVTVDQQLSNGTSTGSFDYWEEGSGFINYTVPRTFLFEYPTTQTLRGSQNIISGEKFSKWNIDYDVKNHRAFLVDQTSPTLIVSKLSPVVGDVTINVNLSGTHNIQFKDPWYIDYVDVSYGDNLRNRGLDAVYRTRTVPFTPNYSTVFENGQTYQGVLLNQNPDFNSGRPAYFLKAPLIGSVTQSDIYAFTHWSVTPSSGASFEDSTALETAVVFKTSGATVTAVYTAVNQIANYTLSIPSDETLTIPAGAGISFADGFQTGC